MPQLAGWRPAQHMEWLPAAELSRLQLTLLIFHALSVSCIMPISLLSQVSASEVSETLCPCKDFLRLRCIVRCTPANPLKYLPYSQRLFPAHWNRLVPAMRDRVGRRCYFAHD